MEPEMLFAIYAAILLVVSLAGAYLPQMGRLKDEHAHMMIAISAGVFIGLLMFILLPEAIEESEEGGIDTHYAMMVVALGFVLIMSINVFMKHAHFHGVEDHEEHEEHDHDHDDDLGHELVSITTFIGLAIHAACDGLALAAVFMTGEEMGLMATIGLCIHKFVELFSLSSTMTLAKIDKKKSMIRLVLFALITPIMGALFFLLFSDMEIEGMLGLPLAFAAGTLMYVTMCDLVPESFHRDKTDVKSYILLLIGLGIMLALTIIFPHSH